MEWVSEGPNSLKNATDNQINLVVNRLTKYQVIDPERGFCLILKFVLIFFR